MKGTVTQLLLIFLAVVFVPFGMLLGKMKSTAAAIFAAILLTALIVGPLTVIAQGIATSEMNMNGDQGWGYALGLYAALFICGFMLAGITIMRLRQRESKPRQTLTLGQSPWPKDEDGR